ncbi:ArsR/SmtB family transcription factor [Natronoarchaeum mannanilyticum]|uniref:HTH arsR-type domain-containing protein n=1 Tax=Natronoarchaeum mannanilyticum TaxID=926360 RepID=A0AAV3TDD1_9EURY
MARILPTNSEATVDRGGDPQLICLDDDRADEILAAVQSDTARSVVRALTEKPMTPTEIAESLEMSVENATYHLDNLEEAGLVAVVDTVYSEKGREMAVYGPAEEPLVLFFGSRENDQGLRAAFAEFVPAIGPVAALIAIKEVLGRSLDLGDLAGDLF